MASKEEVLAAINAVKAVADTIKELGRVPSGELYARLMNHVSRDNYNRMITILSDSGVIRVENFELIWNV